VITLAEHYGMPADEQVADTDWIQEAAQRRWPILMKDKRIRHRQAEITAVTEHKARCFVITRGDLPSADMAQRFITNKAAILAAAMEPGPYIYSVQMDRISRLYP
jgi:PIN like domain